MAKRKIIRIDNDKCTGCGLCVPNCAEGALQIIDGKARLISDLFCDGLGACLGHCPEGAITIEERDAEPYNEHDHQHGHGGGCPGSKIVDLKRAMHGGHQEKRRAVGDAPTGRIKSELKHWPVQIHLASPYAPYFKEADIVIIADCVAYAYAETHREFIKDKVVLIGCPKLDDAAAYVDKIAEIIRAGKPKSIRVIRMEVPCCGGMIEIVKQAIKQSGEVMPFEMVTISIDGRKL